MRNHLAWCDNCALRYVWSGDPTKVNAICRKCGEYLHRNTRRRDRYALSKDTPVHRHSAAGVRMRELLHERKTRELGP